MELKDLVNVNRIITYDDDNHRPDIYVNGKAAGSLEDEMDALVTLFKAGQAAGASDVVTARVYLCDLPDDLTDDETDAIHNFFCKAGSLTIEQELAIFNEDYKTFVNLIK